MRTSLTVSLSLVLLASCSLDVPRADACASSDECRSLFGAGFYCERDSGACTSVTGPGGCAELFPEDAATETDVILFGTLFRRSSDNQRARERAARLVVGGVNAAGGLNGRRVALLHCEATDAQAAQSAADFLVDEVGVSAIVGPSSSIETGSVFSAHPETFVISPSATAVELTAADRSETPGLLWRTAPPDSLQTEVVLAELGDQRISIIARSQDTYADSFSVTIQNAASSTDLTVLESPQFNTADQLPQVADAALAGGPTTVLFLSSSVDDAALFLDAAAGISGYDGVQILFPDAAANEELLTLTADSAGAARYPQVHATRPSVPDTVVTGQFEGAYVAAFEGERPLDFSFTAHAYDATYLMLLGAAVALSEEEPLNGLAIAEHVRAATIGRGAARQLLFGDFTGIVSDVVAGTELDLTGASGDLDYDADTEELTRASYDVLEIRDGSFAVLRSVVADPGGT